MTEAEYIAILAIERLEAVEKELVDGTIELEEGENREDLIAHAKKAQEDLRQKLFKIWKDKEERDSEKPNIIHYK